MNFCTVCKSYYATPGSCNCFAAGGPRAPIGPVTVPDGTTTPVIPHPTVRPWIGDLPNGRSTTISTPCTQCGASGGCQCTKVWYAPLVLSGAYQTPPCIPSTFNALI